MKYLSDAITLADHLKRYFRDHGTDNFSIMLITRLVNETAREIKEELPLHFRDNKLC